MIARLWRGWAFRADAETYETVFRTTVQPHLQGINGYIHGHLLRREQDDEVEFLAITFFDSLDSVRMFAGLDHEDAVVSTEARRTLSRFDGRVTHYAVGDAVDGEDGAHRRTTRRDARGET
jgi:heme-degrading monooxygenase HmoA